MTGAGAGYGENPTVHGCKIGGNDNDERMEGKVEDGRMELGRRGI